MANDEHLAILRQGMNRWNAWRSVHPTITPDLRRANLSGAILREVDLSGADLTNASLTNASLRGASLIGANLQWASLQGANLRGASLRGASLRGANLREAILGRDRTRGVNFREAILGGANPHEANMRGARIGWTVFVAMDLRGVPDLDTVQHEAPSSIDIDTLYLSQGDIPESFLRGCGVPESMIEYARSLVAAQRPIDYYSVFISYSSTDQACAERLHADLQTKGVRCWFAPHDLPIGVPISSGIDEAIRLYDKLLIILSESSVKSTWVAFEVDQALHRELEQGRTMLFPIRLDDTVLHTPSGWARKLHSRNIGDFRGWKDHDRYQAAFARLLRDLQAKDQAGTVPVEE